VAINAVVCSSCVVLEANRTGQLHGNRKWLNVEKDQKKGDIMTFEVPKRALLSKANSIHPPTI
jgi:hypothetical protein